MTVNVRDSIPAEIFDYQILIDALKGLAYPRNRINDALAHYGLIPEGVEALTSVTPNRSRRFSTPVGLFIYRQIPARAYEEGMVRVEEEHGQAFLIASPEKALADKIVSVRGAPIVSIGEMGRFLEEDLRIDSGAICSLSAERIDEFAGRYRSLRLRRLSGYLRRLQRSKKVIPNE